MIRINKVANLCLSENIINPLEFFENSTNPIKSAEIVSLIISKQFKFGHLKLKSESKIDMVPFLKLNCLEIAYMNMKRS